jgi:hypothetical protein
MRVAIAMIPAVSSARLWRHEYHSVTVVVTVTSAIARRVFTSRDGMRPDISRESDKIALAQTENRSHSDRSRYDGRGGGAVVGAGALSVAADGRRF